MEEKTINIMSLLSILWRRLWVVILVAAIFATSAYCYCEFFLTAQYRATASIIVTNGAITEVDENLTNDKDKVGGSDISASLYLSYTIVDILNTPDIYKKLANELGEGYNYQDLMGRKNVERRSEETLFIDVSFTSSDPKEAMRIANKFVEISCDYIPEFIPHSRARVASTAIKASKTYPRSLRTAMMGGLVGAIATYLLFFAIESLNRSIKGTEEFTSTFPEIPLLGAVPDFENVESGGYRRSKGGYGSGY